MKVSLAWSPTGKFRDPVIGPMSLPTCVFRSIFAARCFNFKVDVKKFQFYFKIHQDFFFTTNRTSVKNLFCSKRVRVKNDSDKIPFFLTDGHLCRVVLILFDVFLRTFSDKFFRPQESLVLGGPVLNSSPVALPVGVAQKKDLKK